MKTLVKVNAVTGEITMTKATAQKARSIGSTEYEQLARATKDFPNFKVRVLPQKGKENNNKGLTVGLMREVIRVSKNDNKEDIEAFEKIVVGSKGTNRHFSEPKAYFLSEYPNWREWLLKVEERREEEAKKIKQEQQVQVESAAAVDVQKQRERASNFLNRFRD